MSAPWGAETAGVAILCASYFDRLGHPLLADKIAQSLHATEGPRVTVYGAGGTRADRCQPDAGAVAVPVLFGRYLAIESRSAIRATYGTLGALFSYAVRFIAIVHFYLRCYRACRDDSVIVDLECEPIQALLATLLTRRIAGSRRAFLVHSMPRETRTLGFGYYKRLSVAALMRLLRGPGTRAFFMNRASLETAITRGLPKDQCGLGGWGYDLPHRPVAPRGADPGDGRTIAVLAFGVIRKDKRIGELVDVFSRLNDPRVTLRVIGRSIDVDVAALQQAIRSANSQTRIEVQDRYVAEEEIPGLFAGADVVVLSHSEAFHSLSGPMFLALQHARPILCFSANVVAALVEEAGAGVVCRLDDDLEAVRSALYRLRRWQYEPAALRRYSWPAIASRLVDWS